MVFQDMGCVQRIIFGGMALSSRLKDFKIVICAVWELARTGEGRKSRSSSMWVIVEAPELEPGVRKMVSFEISYCRGDIALDLLGQVLELPKPASEPSSARC